MERTPENKILLSENQCKSVFLSVLDPETRIRAGLVVPKAFGAGGLKSREEKWIEATFESCIFKTMLSCVMGKFTPIFLFFILWCKVVVAY